MGKQWKQCQTLFFGAPKSLQMVTAAMKIIKGTGKGGPHATDLPFLVGKEALHAG